jgi:hypothetical protein
MAGVKVTDLTTLGAADPTDIMYIVDAAANQSRQIQVQNIYDGLPQFASGTYTPTISGENNCIVAPLRAHYSRVNNIVTATINFDFELTGGNVVGSFNLSPPVGSTFASPRDAFGVLTPMTTQVAKVELYEIVADTTFYQISILIQSPNIDDVIQSVVVQIQYLVV